MAVKDDTATVTPLGIPQPNDKQSQSALFRRLLPAFFGVFTSLYTGSILQSVLREQFAADQSGQSFLQIIAKASSPYKVLNNRSRFELALNSSTPPTIYSCDDGNSEFSDFMRDMLPEHKTDRTSLNGPWHGKNGGGLQNLLSGEYDVMVINYGGGGFSGCKQGGPAWLLQRFRGQFVWLSGESGEYPRHLPFDSYENPRHHVFGPHKGGTYDMTLTYLQVTWWNTFKPVLTPAALTVGKLRPAGTRDHFLVYGHGNCVDYRGEAFGRLSTIGPVHQAGRCSAPRGTDPANITNVKDAWGVSIFNWRNNFWAGHFARYRFCLVMEHSDDFPYYVTEKILAAFASGCVPIYYGPREWITRVFNERAFVYYDVGDPDPALRQVARLEANRTLYDRMMAEPIVADGNNTIKEYFSFADGGIKRKLNFPL